MEIKGRNEAGLQKKPGSRKKKAFGVSDELCILTAPSVLVVWSLPVHRMAEQASPWLTYFYIIVLSLVGGCFTGQI